jgi:hypothetical protein
MTSMVMMPSFERTSLELLWAWLKSGWILLMISGKLILSSAFLCLTFYRNASFEERAEKTCEDLLNLALKTDPGNVEALQAFASVRMSQQRPEEAKQCLEKAWSMWKDLDLGIA